MGGADDRPVWARIAERGFADAVESKGFERVGRSHWKMEGDGLTWRVLLVKGYKASPDSFDAVHGAFVHGLDELYSRFEGRRASSLLRQCSVRVHLNTDIGSDVTHAQKAEYDHLYPARREEGWREIWRGLIDPDMRPSFEREFLNIKYWKLTGLHSHQWCFAAANADLQDVADVLSDYWNRYSWTWICRALSFEGLYDMKWGPSVPHDPRVLDPFYYAVARMAGDIAYCNRMTLPFIEDAERPYADVVRECRRNGEVARDRLRKLGITADTYLGNKMWWKRESVERIQSICSSYEIELDPRLQRRMEAVLSKSR